ncbi:hypothetical protein AYO38_03785 [bacterium SCGC AG-212-C10]|nr:hypothetical protein AYO38_03785 [bacterium SCGC AG-212-C10]
MATTKNLEDPDEQMEALVARVEAGEAVALVRDGVEVARMAAYGVRPVRQLGAFAGQIIFTPGWDDPEDWDEFLDDPNDPLR